VDEERRREVGLFRYALIRIAADSGLSKAERGRLVRALAEQEHVGPDGRLVRISRSTLDEWVRAYRRGGFEALCPRARRVLPRTSLRLLALAVALKRERPQRTAAQVHQIMLAAGERPPTVRTLQTHLARAGLNVRADGRSPNKVYGRFEASARNELWTGDGLHGPKLADGKRAVLLAFIDDHSRLLVGWRWGTGEDVIRLEAALRTGFLSRGVPGAILVDRGSAFVSSQLFRACAVMGVKLIHASPRAATTKGKIERFFRTVRDQFLVEIDERAVVDLAQLNRLFSAWVEVVYHRRVHSETEQTPLARFEAQGAPALPTPAVVREAFLWCEERTVTRTATVSLHANSYEVDPALVGRKVELLFDPFDLTRIEVRYQRRPFGLAIPQVIGRHTHPHAKTDSPPPPAATGIDYLQLLEDQRAAEQKGYQIDYASLTNIDEGTVNSNREDNGDSDSDSDSDSEKHDEGQKGSDK
jgi:putative transposase